MSERARACMPWLVACALLVLLLLLAQRLPTLRENGQSAVLVPIRPPLTRPDPAEALLLSEKAPDPDATDPAGPGGNGGRSEVLRHEITFDGYEIGRLLSTEQLLFVLSQRDRMERDFYVGRVYRELEAALRERAGP